MNRMTAYSTLLASGLMLAACGDSGEPMMGENALEEEFCEHMIEGPAMAFTATASAADAPDITLEHMRADVTLPATGTGWVKFQAEAIAEFSFALSADVPLKVTRARDGLLVTAERTEDGSEICTEVVKQYLYDFEIGEYWLELGPGTGTTPLGIVPANVAEVTGGADHNDDGG